MSGADFDTGQLVHWRYAGTPPRMLALVCAHELTHTNYRRARWPRVPFRARMGIGGPG
jgi:hypothetical protein